MIDAAELEAAIAAVYEARLPIPVWWPDEERSAFIEEYAGEAACVLISELDGIVDRVTDWAARLEVSGEERSAMIASSQQVLLDEARCSVQYDMAEAIADRSAALVAESVFGHSSRRPQRVIWPAQR